MTKNFSWLLLLLLDGATYHSKERQILLYTFELDARPYMAKQVVIRVQKKYMNTLTYVPDPLR